MSKHTPGPWSVGNPTGFRNQISIEPAIGCVYGAGDEIAANARLIASAPDMLEALEAIADFAPGYGDVCEIIAQRARAAIAKATGDDDASQV